MIDQNKSNKNVIQTGRILLTTKEAAAYTKRSMGTLEIDRHEGKGFPYLRVFGKIFYDKDELDRIIETSRVRPGREKRAWRKRGRPRKQTSTVAAA